MQTAHQRGEGGCPRIGSRSFLGWSSMLGMHGGEAGHDGDDDMQRYEGVATSVSVTRIEFNENEGATRKIQGSRRGLHEER